MSISSISVRRSIIKTHRKALARAVIQRHRGVVQQGPFRGMKLDGHANISDAALGLKILGLYGVPVVEQLLRDGPVETFIDIGAGEGYYPIGLLQSGTADKVVCFEATSSGREAIRRNAEINAVEGRIHVFGLAVAGADVGRGGLWMP